MLDDPGAAQAAFFATSPTCAASGEAAAGSATHAACHCAAAGTEQDVAAAAAAGGEASAPAAVFHFAPEFGSFVESLVAMAAEEGAERSPRAEAAATARASAQGGAACKGFCRLSSTSRSFVRERGLNESAVRSQRDRPAAAPLAAAPPARPAPPSATAEAELRQLQADALRLHATAAVQSEMRRAAERAATSPPRVAAALSSTAQGAAPAASYPPQAPPPQAPPPLAPLPPPPHAAWSEAIRSEAEAQARRMEAAALAQAQAQAAPQAQELAQLQAFAHSLGASPPPPPHPLPLPHPPPPSHPPPPLHPPQLPQPPQQHSPQQHSYPGGEEAAADYDQLVESVVRRAWEGALTRHASQHPRPHLDATSHPDHAATSHPADRHYQPATAHGLPPAAAPPRVQPLPRDAVQGHTPGRAPFSSGYGMTRPNAARAKERAATPPPRTTGRAGVGSYAVQHRRNLQRGAQSGGYGIRS